MFPFESTEEERGDPGRFTKKEEAEGAEDSDDGKDDEDKEEERDGGGEQAQSAELHPSLFLTPGMVVAT